MHKVEGTAWGWFHLLHSCDKYCNHAQIVLLWGRRTHKRSARRPQYAATTRRGQEQAPPRGLPPGGLGGRASGGMAAKGFLNFLYSRLLYSLLRLGLPLANTVEDPVHGLPARWGQRLH